LHMGFGRGTSPLSCMQPIQLVLPWLSLRPLWSCTAPCCWESEAATFEVLGTSCGGWVCLNECVVYKGRARTPGCVPRNCARRACFCLHACSRRKHSHRRHHQHTGSTEKDEVRPRGSADIFWYFSYDVRWPQELGSVAPGQTTADEPLWQNDPVCNGGMALEGLAGPEWRKAGPDHWIRRGLRKEMKMGCCVAHVRSATQTLAVLSSTAQPVQQGFSSWCPPARSAFRRLQMRRAGEVMLCALGDKRCAALTRLTKHAA